MTLAQEQHRVAVVLIGLTVVASPLLGAAYELGSTDGMGSAMPHRLVFSALGIAVLLASQRSTWLQARLPLVVKAGLWVYAAWYLWLASATGFTLPRVLGVLLVQACAILMHRDVPGITAFHGMVVGLAAVGMARAGVPVDVVAVSLGCLSAMAVLSTSAVWLQRRRLTRLTEQAVALARLRDELEARVEERTAALQQEVDDRRRAEERARSASVAKSTFLATMSHELRTPLNAILGYAELIEEALEGPDEAARRDVLRIHRAGEHLLTMINEVLDLAKVESGKLELDVTPSDLDAVIDGAVATVSPLLQRSGIDLQQRRDVAGLVLPLDRGRVQQVLVNLLGNTAKFAPGAPVELRVWLEGPWVHLGVRDHGPGLPASRIGSVFEPFVQLEASPSRRKGGTGLGLAISRDLARLMGGDLVLEPGTGGGAAFVFRLPLPAEAAA